LYDPGRVPALQGIFVGTVRRDRGRDHRRRRVAHHPIRLGREPSRSGWPALGGSLLLDRRAHGSGQDRKSTRLNSSHVSISYAVYLTIVAFFPTRRSSDLLYDPGRVPALQGIFVGTVRRDRGRDHRRRRVAHHPIRLGREPSRSGWPALGGSLLLDRRAHGSG